MRRLRRLPESRWDGNHLIWALPLGWILAAMFLWHAVQVVIEDQEYSEAPQVWFYSALILSPLGIPTAILLGGGVWNRELPSWLRVLVLPPFLVLIAGYGLMLLMLAVGLIGWAMSRE